MMMSRLFPPVISWHHEFHKLTECCGKYFLLSVLYLFSFSLMDGPLDLLFCKSECLFTIQYFAYLYQVNSVASASNKIDLLFPTWKSLTIDTHTVLLRKDFTIVLSCSSKTKIIQQKYPISSRHMGKAASFVLFHCVAVFYNLQKQCFSGKQKRWSGKQCLRTSWKKQVMWRNLKETWAALNTYFFLLKT